MKSKKIGVAISGGVDSVVLSSLCKQEQLQFVLVHCNFHLRIEESDRDEAFIRGLAKQYGVAALIEHFETVNYANENSLSIQEAARELRYSWFRLLHEKKECDVILLAHHANDNIETLLFNFFRGTGIEGVTGMPHKVEHAFCLRPLLSHTRSEIEQFAQEHRLQWVEDSSNASDTYTRNFIRHEIIPMVKKRFPSIEDNLLNNIKRFQKTATLYRAGVEQLKKKMVEPHGSEVRIPVLKLMQFQHTSLLYEVVKEYGFGEKQVDELIKLAGSESGKYIESSSHKIIKHRKHFIIVPQSTAAETVTIDDGSTQVQLQEKTFQITKKSSKNFHLVKSQSVAQLNADLVEYPLLLRKWRKGDYFYPLGMRKKKKLSRFFIDQKLSATEKENVWILESAKRIVWVVGLRIDDRFKITPSTSNFLEISVATT